MVNFEVVDGRPGWAIPFSICDNVSWVLARPIRLSFSRPARGDPWYFGAWEGRPELESQDDTTWLYSERFPCNCLSSSRSDLLQDPYGASLRPWRIARFPLFSLAPPVAPLLPYPATSRPIMPRGWKQSRSRTTLQTRPGRPMLTPIRIHSGTSQSKFVRRMGSMRSDWDLYSPMAPVKPLPSSILTTTRTSSTTLMLSTSNSQRRRRVRLYSAVRTLDSLLEGRQPVRPADQSYEGLCAHDRPQWARRHP